MTTTRMSRAVGTMLGLTLLIPAAAVAQERVGVATTVVGAVTVTHVASAPAPLKFKDDVLLNDRITTGDKGFARMLLGGKAVVTAREHSVITINEVPGVATVDLASGRVSIAVDKSKMRPGDVVEIRTPNAVAGIRGTVVVAEATGSASSITVLRGLVDVYRRDPTTGVAFGPATPVGPRESVTVKGSVLPAQPRAITPAQASGLSNEFKAPVQPVSPTSTMRVADEVTRAQNVLAGLAGGSQGAAPAAQDDKAAGKTDKAATPGNGNGNGNGNRAAAGAPGVSAQPVATVSAPTTTAAPAPAAVPTVTAAPTVTAVPTVTVVPTVSAVPTVTVIPAVIPPVSVLPTLPVLSSRPDIIVPTSTTTQNALQNLLKK
jgi:hypothetical protein